MAEGGKKDSITGNDNKDLTKNVLCKNCNKECLTKEATGKKKEFQSVQCEECGDHYHKMCTDIGNKEWELVTGPNESILFKCPRCIVNKGKKFQEMKELKKEISEVKNEMSEFKALFTQNKKMEREISEVKSEMSDFKALLIQNNTVMIQQLKAEMFPEVENIIEKKIE